MLRAIILPLIVLWWGTSPVHGSPLRGERLEVLNQPQPGSEVIDVRLRVDEWSGRLELRRERDGVREVVSSRFTVKGRFAIQRFRLRDPAEIGDSYTFKAARLCRESVDVRVLRGDVNVDGSVDLCDLDAMRRRVGGAEEGESAAGQLFRAYRADADADGDFDDDDLALVEELLLGQVRRLEPMPSGAELWHPDDIDDVAIRRLIEGMGDRLDLWRARYCSTALLEIGAPAVPSLIRSAEAVDPGRYFIGGNLTSSIVSRGYSPTETRLAEAFLLLVECVRRQRDPSYVLPWFYVVWEEAEGIRSRRLTSAEFDEVLAAYRSWDEKWDSVPVSHRDPPALPDEVRPGT